jgi:hypothetical protein
MSNTDKNCKYCFISGKSAYSWVLGKKTSFNPGNIKKYLRSPMNNNVINLSMMNISIHEW